LVAAGQVSFRPTIRRTSERIARRIYADFGRRQQQASQSGKIEAPAFRHISRRCGLLFTAQGLNVFMNEQ
jgi:hypothetical protein